MPPASKRFRSDGHTLVRTHTHPPTQHSPSPGPSQSQSASAQSMAAPHRDPVVGVPVGGDVDGDDEVGGGAPLVVERNIQ
eukprot:scaffold56799_cov51-Phaeocystis_antarctica.AAC.1